MGRNTEHPCPKPRRMLLAISKAACGAGLQEAPIEAKTGIFSLKIRIDSWMSMELSK